jgi:hypothetical protein
MSFTFDVVNRTYLISAPIIAYYYSQLIGDARKPPILLASAGFVGFAVIGWFETELCMSFLRPQTRCESVYSWRKRGSVVHKPEQFVSIIIIVLVSWQLVRFDIGLHLASARLETWSLIYEECLHLQPPLGCIGKYLKQHRSLMSS